MTLLVWTSRPTTPDVDLTHIRLRFATMAAAMGSAAVAALFLSPNQIWIAPAVVAIIGRLAFRLTRKRRDPAAR